VYGLSGLLFLGILAVEQSGFERLLIEKKEKRKKKFAQNHTERNLK